MIIDDKKHFVELTVDAIMCGTVKYDFNYFSSRNSDELKEIMTKMGFMEWTPVVSS